MDPIKAVGLVEAQVDRDLFEGLVNQDVSGKAIPGMAMSWQTSDNQNYVFHLRRDARWSIPPIIPPSPGLPSLRV